jgi:hypothetical protein
MKEQLCYFCDYCGRMYKKKVTAYYHELKCYHDPKNKACATCGYLDTHGTPTCTAYNSSSDPDDILMPLFESNCNFWKPKEKENEQNN